MSNVSKGPVSSGSSPISPTDITRPKSFVFDGQTYCVENLIGAGRSGQVYSARAESGSRRAIKIINSKDGALREANLGIKVQSPNVIQTRGIATTDSDQVGIVMGVGSGSNVLNIITSASDEGAPISDERTRQILLGIALGLRALHGKGIIHRDVKPSNALFDTETGVSQLFDLGVAADLSNRTVTYRLGTTIYASSEQLLPDTPPAPSMDVYSLAATGYALVLSGAVPFELESLERLPIVVKALRSAVHKMDPERYKKERKILEQFGATGHLIANGLNPEPTERPTVNMFISALS